MEHKCCDEWAKATGTVLSESATRIVAARLRPPADVQIEFIKGWQVSGCCGGHCYVLSDLKFCPWCAAALPQEGTADG